MDHRQALFSGFTRRTVIAAAAVLCVAFVTSVVMAHGGATGIVKKRMDFMESMGDAMKEITAMMRGKQAYDAGRLRALAGTVGDHGGEALTKLFPEGSLDKPTEALPAIWTDWERFSALADRLSDYATALQAAAENERPASAAGMSGGMMQGGGGMMGDGENAMTGGAMMGNSMMGTGQAGPSVEHLATMPPDAAYMHLAQVCAACHEDFRKEK